MIWLQVRKKLIELLITRAELQAIMYNSYRNHKYLAIKKDSLYQEMWKIQTLLALKELVLQKGPNI